MSKKSQCSLKKNMCLNFIVQYMCTKLKTITNIYTISNVFFKCPNKYLKLLCILSDGFRYTLYKMTLDSVFLI